MSKRKVYGLFGVIWAAAVVLAAPVMAAAPGYDETNIGAPDENGSVTVDGDKWTVLGAGNDFNGATEDQLFFVSKTIKGNGSVQARLLGPEQGGQYVGIMIRESTNANAPMAGLIMSTSTLAWITRPAADEPAVRQNGASTEEYPKWMRLQRVGNSITGFTSADGKLWQQIAGPITLPLAETSVMGVAVSSRSSSAIEMEFEGVQVQEGVVSVTGIEGAATDKLALISWEQIPTAVGYNVYRGPKDATLDKLTLLNTSGPQLDTFYFDNAASDTPLRSLSYVVAPVFKGADGKTIEGPAVRAR
jgi:regulation of enolase protein 1 (concanavalin A-like superfamily)